LRQLVDAGTLANLPGGFKTRGLRTKGDDTPIAPGEFRDVDVPSGTIKDNLMTLPYKEPSQTLMALLQQIIEEGRRFAGSAQLETSDMSAQAPVGTTLAILERTLKMMSAVQARVHYAMKQEFKLLKDIIRDYTPEEYSYEPSEGGRKAKQSDYDMVEVIPVSDPNAATMAQKVVQYQAALQLAQGAPQLYDLPLLHRQMLEVLGIKNYQKLIPIEDEMKPRDPVTENQNILKGKPVKAFLYQDHKAHIAVHMAAVQDPHIMELIGKDPQLAGKVQAAMSAHVADHLGMEYRKQLEQRIGMTLPAYEDDQDEAMMSPEMEVQVSQQAAMAAQQMLQQNQQQAQQKKNQDMAQDPLIMLQKQELEIKAQDLQRKAKKDNDDLQTKMAQLQVEVQRLQAQHELEQQKIDMQHEADGAKAALKMFSDQSQREAQQEQMGHSAGVDLIRHREQLNHQRETDREKRAHEYTSAQEERAHQAKQAEQKPKADKK
jgi:hypothetical protein